MKVAVILGKRLKDDGSFTGIMRKRMALTLKLFKEENPDYIIVSGGIANAKANIAEGQKMYDYLVEKGIPKENLIRETSSMTTKENAKFSVPMAISLKADSIIICTTKEHMNRPYLNPYRLFKDEIDYHKANIKLIKYSGKLSD